MSGGKEGVWRGELEAAREAYRQVTAREERMKRRMAARDVAMDKCMRALTEAKIYIGKMPAASKKDGHMDPKTATVSLINRAIRGIKEARDS